MTTCGTGSIIISAELKQITVTEAVRSVGLQKDSIQVGSITRTHIRDPSGLALRVDGRMLPGKHGVAEEAVGSARTQARRPRGPPNGGGQKEAAKGEDVVARDHLEGDPSIALLERLKGVRPAETKAQCEFIVGRYPVTLNRRCSQHPKGRLETLVFPLKKDPFRSHKVVSVSSDHIMYLQSY